VSGVSSTDDTVIAGANDSLRAEAQDVRVAHVSKSFAGIDALRDVSLRVAAGRMLALLGPSGCGKTTLLRVIAGLERPDTGEVSMGEHVLTSAKAFVAPERRRVGMVFQDWALFPHLSVERNVAYGLPKLDGSLRRRRVSDALELVGLGDLGPRAPATLSGGQQQRVALARALAPRPAVLLLDEPFSNLDTALRVHVRTEVHRLLAGLGITTVFVTHDQEEAFVLGDEVAVMEEGRVVQQATPADLYRSPSTRWIASFVGDANLVPGTVNRTGNGAVADTVLGAIPIANPTSGAVDVLVRPEAVALAPGPGGTVELVEFYGHDTVYAVHLADGTQLRSRQSASPRFARGDSVQATYSGEPTVAYPTERPARSTATTTPT
jgi:iron(III) transport system ATP-binding protein